MLLAPPSPFVASMTLPLVAWPVFLYLAAALAVLGSVVVVIAVLRAQRPEAEPPVIVTGGPRVRTAAAVLPEAA
ncbi:MAG: hypothetical protein KIT14_21355 [bacterium]|nr:hypothetical protein [bacterium]